METRKLGIALVGLGNYSEKQLGPALLETNYCRLAGIVTGTPEKASVWKEKYNLPDSNIYNYENFDSIRDNPDIDIVYIVLPNNMHASFTIRAAEAGKHVIVEKPMAITVKDCEKMIAACKKADRLLGVGYRLHSDPFNLAIMDMGQQRKFGRVNTIISKNGRTINEKVWRVDKKMSGGGPLTDMGVYCVQAVMYVLGEEPLAVTAAEGKKTKPEIFENVEQSVSWTMEFPSGAIAYCETSYADDYDMIRVDAEDGWFGLEPAFDYDGLQGNTSEGPIVCPEINQQAQQMDDFAQCILEGKPTKVPGEMGMRDVRILNAIYHAMETRKRVELKFKEVEKQLQ